MDRLRKKLILASASPRRREILGQIGIPFEVCASDAEEIYTAEQPEGIVKELALLKARAAAEKLAEKEQPQTAVLGADTVVVLDGKILGKPSGEAEAYAMIHALQGRSHQVCTGVAMLHWEENGRQIARTHAETTEVSVCPMTEEEIREYLAQRAPDGGTASSGCRYEWEDKAGAYGIQGTFAKYVERIEGDYYNVVGLPAARVYQMWKEIQEEM